MAGERRQVDAASPEVEGGLARALAGIEQEQRPGRAGADRRCQARYVIAGAGFVVRELEGHQPGVSWHGVDHQAAERIDRQEQRVRGRAQQR